MRATQILRRWCHRVFHRVLTLALCRWRRYCNEALRRDYPVLWSRIDTLWFLQPPGFDIVRTWRWEQEQAMAARDPSRTRMDRAQLDRFIQHYERTSRHLLATLPALAERVVALDEQRRPITT